MENKEVVLMFSGGIDSTLTAVELAKKFDKVHLITYDQGKWLWFMKQANLHVKELNEIIGPKFQHKFLPNNKLFKKINSGFCKDYLDYCRNKAPFLFCLNCKLAMHTRSVIYCIEHGIGHFADGAVETQNDRPEMMPGVLTILEEFYKEYGIEFSSPIYHFGTRDDERRALKKLGFTLGLQTGDLHKTIQPLCIPGILYAYWHYASYPIEEDVIKFAKSKLEIVRKEIEEYFKDKPSLLEKAKSKNKLLKTEQREE